MDIATASVSTTLEASASNGMIDRRRALRFGGGLAGATALAGLARPARAASETSLDLDMACDGRTMRWIGKAPGEEDRLPLPGDTFVVFGSLYPAGTIDNGLTGPDQPGAIGRWICRGTFVIDIASGAVPHVVTTVLNVLGDGLSATAGAVEQAPDAIVTEGFEGGLEVAHRAVTGGYGGYAGARGPVVQTLRGENDTLIQIAPDVAVPAPNYTFQFTFTEE